MAIRDWFDAPVQATPSPEKAPASIDRALHRLRQLAHDRPAETSEEPPETRSAVHQLLEDAEHITYELLEEAARFRQGALSDAEQLRLEGERQAASLLDEARATANRLSAEGERARANLLDQARVEVERVRGRAEAERTALVRAAKEHAHKIGAEAQHDRAALLQGARAEAGRLRAEAEDERTAVVDAAHAQAERILEQARDEAAALVATSRAQGEEVRAAAEGAEGVRPTRRPITPMHSSEIGAREFPRSWRGLDPAPVQKWLSLVESSQATLEDEVDRLQAAWDDAVECLARLKIRLTTLQMTQGNPTLHHELEHARDEWEQAARALTAGARAGRGNRSTFESMLVRQAMLEAPIRRHLFGYSRAEVDRLLASSAAQVARLENRASILSVENQQLRERVLAQASWGLPAQAGRSPDEGDPAPSVPRMLEPSTVGADDQISAQR